jgi:hypothetical protein
LHDREVGVDVGWQFGQFDLNGGRSVVHFYSRDGLRLAIFKDLEVVFVQIGDGVSFAIRHDNVYQNQSDFRFDGWDGLAGFRRRGLGVERYDKRNQRNEIEKTSAAR